MNRGEFEAALKQEYDYWQTVERYQREKYLRFRHRQAKAILPALTAVNAWLWGAWLLGY